MKKRPADEAHSRMVEVLRGDADHLSLLDFAEHVSPNFEVPAWVRPLFESLSNGTASPEDVVVQEFN